ncbi:MAG: hypothetical protein ABSF09_12265 [Candidatus Bathyarchaeia archaeon]|jgi:hypothetical protein
MTNRRFCVFCGAKPETRTREHIIPQWLIELTGDPKRKAIFGPFWNTAKREFEMHTFAFDQFTVASCDACNMEFSKLEKSTKQIIESILKEKPLDSRDFHILLSWLDKVRVGLWLAYYSVQKNIWEIVPQFFVKSRMDMSDRMVLIYRSDLRDPRLRVEGHTVPAFQYQPTCFVLNVNQFILFNISTSFLLSERMGLPYAFRRAYTNTPQIETTLANGRNRIVYPLVRFKYDHHCAEIFQPIFTSLVGDPYYQNEHVKSISLDHSKGVGRIFYYDKPFVLEYPNSKSISWLPKWTWRDDALWKVIRKQWLEIQLHLFEYGPCATKISLEHVDKPKRRLVQSQVQISKKISRTFLDSI